MPAEALILLVSGFFAGAVNAIAGGGSLLTLGGLLFLGVPLVVANATGTLALLPGYMLASWRMRRDVCWPAGFSPVLTIAIVVVGAVAGALLLTALPEAVFGALLPFLLLFASMLLLLSGSGRAMPRLPVAFAACLLMLCCVYGGYFNGGLGFVLLAVLALMGMGDLQSMNALKNVISMLLTLVAVCVYWRAGVLDAGAALWLGVGAGLGAYAAAALSYRIPAQLLRAVIALFGLALSLFLLWP